MLRYSIVVIAAATLFCGEAEACSIPPPVQDAPFVGETAEAFQQRVEARRAQEEADLQAQLIAFQRQTWEEASSVVIARVVRREEAVPLRNEYGEVYGQSPRAHLRVERWLKGQARGRPSFSVRYAGLTSCGSFGGGDAVDGAVGAEFVVFLSAGRLRESRVINSLALDRVMAPELRDMLTASN